MSANCCNQMRLESRNNEAGKYLQLLETKDDKRSFVIFLGGWNNEGRPKCSDFIADVIGLSP